MSYHNILSPGPAATLAANLMRDLLDKKMNLGKLDSGRWRRSMRDMLHGPQIDLDDPATVQEQLAPIQDLVEALALHLDQIYSAAAKARREAAKDTIATY